jgi:hypothetical protein
MVDISAIAGTVSALKGATDIAKAMVGLHDAQAVQTKVIELNAKILEAQSSALLANDERSALIERVGHLEKELARLKAWEAEKQRYELKEIAAGALAYVPKESMRGTEPMHWLCANCYQNDKKCFLQAHRADASFIYHKCQECGGEIRLPKPPSPPRQAIATTRYNPLSRR